MYIGGNEHAVRHLLYARFVMRSLHDMGLVPAAEPYTRFRAHGMIIMDGAKMSKSRGNVLNPDEYIERYGADTVRALHDVSRPVHRSAGTSVTRASPG